MTRHVALFHKEIKFNQPQTLVKMKHEISSTETMHDITPREQLMTGCLRCLSGKLVGEAITNVGTFVRYAFHNIWKMLQLITFSKVVIHIG